MNKIVTSFLIYLLMAVFAFGQVQDHPLKNFNVPVESQEFIIMSAQANSSNQPLLTTLGSFNLNDSSTNQQIKVRPDVTNSSTFDVGDGKYLSVITLDYDGDSYDEPVYILEKNENPTSGSNKFYLAFPQIGRDPYQQNSIVLEQLRLPPYFGLYPLTDIPAPKMTAGDFDGDGKEEIALLWRNFDRSYRTWIEVLKVNTAGNGTEVIKFTDVSQKKEPDARFDLAAGDWDGDGLDDLAVGYFREPSQSNGQPGSRICYVDLLKTSSGSMGFTRHTEELSFIGASKKWENISLAAGSFLPGQEGKEQVAVALAFEDSAIMDQLNQRVYVVDPNDNVDGVDMNDEVFSDFVFGPSPRSAVAIDAGDISQQGDGLLEFAVAFDGAINLFKYDSTSQRVAKLGPGTGVGVESEFYNRVPSNDYLSVEDINLDGQEDVVVFWDDIDFNSSESSIMVSVYLLEQGRVLREKGKKKVLTAPYNGADDLRVFAATLGEFSGGRGILRAPRKFTRSLFSTVTVTGGPPHHFDVLNGTTEVDVTNSYPSWPNGSVAAPGTFEAFYSTSSTTTSTMQTTFGSSWGISGTVEVDKTIPKIKVGVEASLKTSYGEGFSKTNIQEEEIQVTNVYRASNDDELIGKFHTVDIYEYPIDSAGVIIDYVVVMIRKDINNQPFLKIPSKQITALDYRPRHQVGNILSYPSLSDFDQYYGIKNRVKEDLTGYAVGGGNLEFQVNYSSFTSQNQDTTEDFGVEAMVKGSYKGYSLKVEGDYSTNSLRSHTSAVKEDITFGADLGVPLNGNFADANYFIYPIAYWGENGAINIGYAVDPAGNYWSANYGNEPDLTFILPYIFDSAKGLTYSVEDQERESRSISVENGNEDVSYAFLPGDTVEISGFIHNFSLFDYNSTVNVKVYDGDPAKGANLLSDQDGQTQITVSGNFRRGNRVPFTFNWKAHARPDTVSRIYVELDSDNAISEIHEDNNIGWIGIGDQVNSNPTSTLPEPKATEVNLYPNPTTSGWTQVDLEITSAKHVKIDIMDLQGRMLANPYSNRLSAGGYLYPIDLNAFPDGIYLLRIDIDGEIVSKKVVKSTR
ncbi:MAG: T9SS type A sorting domain-containing protein [Bacteroidota bacterium]